MAASPPGPTTDKIRNVAFKRLRQQAACLWGEMRYLRSLVKNKPLHDCAASYVSLNAIRARSKGEKQPAMPLVTLMESCAHESLHVMVLGEPGSGKTTSLYALTYRFAQRAWRWQKSCWIIFLSLVLVLIFRLRPWRLIAGLHFEPNVLFKFSGILTAVLLCMVAALFFLDWIFRKWPLPLLIELRQYQGEPVEQFLKTVIAKAVGGRAIADQFEGYIDRRRVVVLLHGINELNGKAYTDAIKHWRPCFRPPQDLERVPIILTSRGGLDDPTVNLGLSEDRVFTIQDLDDIAVKEYLRVYGAKHVDVDFERLKSNNLLGQGGLGRNPYWLKALIKHFSAENPGRLFEIFAQDLLGREESMEPGKRSEASSKDHVPMQAEMALLGKLALEMHGVQEVGCSLRQATAILEEQLAKLKPSYESDRVLSQAHAATLMRISDSDDRADFAHQLVQDFFAAYALRLEPFKAAEHATERWWWRTLLMLGGLVKSQISYGEALMALERWPLASS